MASLSREVSDSAHDFFFSLIGLSMPELFRPLGKHYENKACGTVRKASQGLSMPTPSNETAIGKSISFFPGSLYEDAKTFGETQSPTRNPSQVVCEALRHYFEAKGYRPNGQNEQAELLAAASEIGLPEALKLLRKRLRRAA